MSGSPRMCACCYDKSRTDIGSFICPSCIEEWRIIRRLYTIAAHKFDSIKTKSVSEFVRIIWAKLGLDIPEDIKYTGSPSKKVVNRGPKRTGKRPR